MPADSRDGRPADDGGDVVPAKAPARRMTRPVEPVAGEVGEIDAAHEGQLVVDDHELLVVAMQRPFMRIERAHDLVALAERFPDAAHGTSRDRIQRQGSTSPEEHAHRHPASRVGEQIAQDRGCRPGRQREIRRDAPAGDVHVGAGARDRLGDARERHLAVDQHLDRVPAGGRFRPDGPARIGGRQCVLPPHPPQPPAVMRAHGALDGVPDDAVQALDQAGYHQATIPAPRDLTPPRPGGRVSQAPVRLPS